MDHCHFNNATGKQFDLILKNSECKESNGFATCARTLILKLLKTKQEVVMTATKLASGQYIPTVSLSGREENWVKTKDLLIEKVGKENVIVTLTTGLKIQWTGRNAYVTVNPSFENQTCGLCGTFNHNMQDDFHTKTGSTESAVSIFTQNWIYKDSNINNDENCHKYNENIDACDIFSAKRSNADAQCAIIKSTSGPFKLCHSVVPPEQYYKMCRQDGCKCESCLCDVIASYSKVCMDKGIHVNDWRPHTSTCTNRKFIVLRCNTAFWLPSKLLFTRCGHIERKDPDTAR